MKSITPTQIDVVSVTSRKTPPETDHCGIFAIWNLWNQFHISKLLGDCGIKKRSGEPLDRLYFSIATKGLIEEEYISEMSREVRKDVGLSSFYASVPDQSTLYRNIIRPTLEQIDCFYTDFIQELQKRKRLRANKEGVLIFDATTHHVRGTKKHVLARYVYDSKIGGPIWGYSNCVLLYSNLDHSVHYPTDFVLQEDGRTVLLQMMEKSWERLGVEVRRVAFDGGLFSKDFYSELDENQILFYTKGRYGVYYGHEAEKLKLDKLYEQIPEEEFKNKLKVAERFVNWEGYDFMLRMVFVKKVKEEKGYFVVLTNDLESPINEVLEVWEARSYIEHTFKEEKQYLGLGDFPCGNYHGIIMYVALVFLTYTLLIAMRLYSGKFVKRSIKTIREFFIQTRAEVKLYLKKIRVLLHGLEDLIPLFHLTVT